MTTNVLVIDDSSMVRKQVGNELRRTGYSVVEAVDGLDALGKLDGCATSLILCDLHMPNMNGLELLERLNSSGSTIPIVMLTAEVEHEFIRRAKELGAKAWLIKPFKPESIAAIAARYAPIGDDPAKPAS